MFGRESNGLRSVNVYYIFLQVQLLKFITVLCSFIFHSKDKECMNGQENVIHSYPLTGTSFDYVYLPDTFP